MTKTVAARTHVWYASFSQGGLLPSRLRVAFAIRWMLEKGSQMSRSSSERNVFCRFASGSLPSSSAAVAAVAAAAAEAALRSCEASGVRRQGGAGAGVEGVRTSATACRRAGMMSSRKSNRSCSFTVAARSCTETSRAQRGARSAARGPACVPGAGRVPCT